MCAPTVLVRCTLDEFMVLTCGLQRPRAPTGSGTWTSTGSTATNYTVTGLTNGTAYTFRVRAVNSIGESDASTEATATPSPDPDPDPEPEPEPVPALPLLGQLLLALGESGPTACLPDRRAVAGRNDVGTALLTRPTTRPFLPSIPVWPCASAK